MTTEDRQAHWRTIIGNQAASGMNIAAYCRASHIHPSLFYIWHRKFREQQPFAGGFVELTPGRPDDAASGIRIRLGVKLSIEVARGFDPFPFISFPFISLTPCCITVIMFSRCVITYREADMVRTQIQLSEGQVAMLKEMAVADHKSMAEIIRQSVDYFAKAKYGGGEEQRRRRAMAAAGQFRSGVKDLAASHDSYLTEAFGE